MDIGLSFAAAEFQKFYSGIFCSCSFGKLYISDIFLTWHWSWHRSSISYKSFYFV